MTVFPSGVGPGRLRHYQGFGLLEVLIALSLVVSGTLSAFAAASAGQEALHSARREVAGLAAGRDQMEALVSRIAVERTSGFDHVVSGGTRLNRVWRVRPWLDHPGLQRIEVSVRWEDGDLMILDLVAAAR